VVAWLVLALWPPLAAPLDGSFDSSWRWGLAARAVAGAPPALLSYGPLGHWLEPRAIEGGGLAVPALLLVLVRAAWLAALLALWRARPEPGRWAGAAALLIGATWLAGRWSDWELALVVLALVGGWASGGRSGAGALLAAGALTGLASFLKVSAGAGAWAAVVAALAARRFVARAPIAAGGSALAAGLFAGLAVGLASGFSAPREALGWARALPAVISGYGASMALPSTPAARLAVAVPVLAAAAMLLYARAVRSPALGFWCAAALPVALAARHALVRPDLHALAAPFAGVGALALGALLERRPRAAGLALALGVTTLAAAAPHARHTTAPAAAGLARLALGVEGARALPQALAPISRARELRAAQAGALERWRIPAPEQLVPGGVDVVPWRIVALEASGLGAAWVPSPAFQLYQASAPALERRMAEHFAGGRAPRWILLHDDPIDRRQPLWEAPRAWREIAARYRVRGPAGAFRLLERRVTPRRWVERELGRGELAWGRWARVPRAGDGESVWAEVELDPTPVGRLRRLALRAEPVWLDTAGGGPKSAWRLVPDLARFGLALDAPPGDLGELADWVERGSTRERLRRIRLRSSDAGRYRPVRVRWLALRLAEAS
jgi:hypothetical protein